MDSGNIYHLHAAVQGGSLGIVKAILNHRADDRARHNTLMTEEDKCGRCAIHVAAMKGNWDIIAEFISKMPDSVEILCLDHKSVLHFGVEYNRTKVVENLLEGKEKEEVADRVSRDCDLCQNTALHLAAKNGVDSELFDLLLSSSSVNVNALNNEGMTTLDIALTTPQDNSSCSYTVRKFKGARGAQFKGTLQSDTIHDEIVNTHMVVASLIATITFAAMFTIPEEWKITQAV